VGILSVLGLRRLSLILILTSYISAMEVYVSNKRISYQKQITSVDFIKKDVKKVKRNCKPMTYKQLKSKKYYAKHIILKNSVVCQSDVKIINKEKVIFNFNDVFEIEKNGKVLRQTKEYVRFKNHNGKIETIYKR
jgi:5-bromo-4-chloroindolyl phosphate hydrolysis protein